MEISAGAKTLPHIGPCPIIAGTWPQG